MAHGFAGVKEHGLDRFARLFAEAGFVVLVHDHRGFGASGGSPRFDVDPWVQIADWRRAISFLESQPVVDADRIGLWGTSYAGGHAIVLGATDRRLRAVVAQVPTISGYQQSLRRVAPDLVPALEAAFADDERRQFHGAPPATQAVVSADPSVPAAYRSPDAIAFYTQPVPEGVWENAVTLRSTRAARMYEPGTVDLAGLPHAPADDRGPARHHHRHRPCAGRLRAGAATQEAGHHRRRSLRPVPRVLRRRQRCGVRVVHRAPHHIRKPLIRKEYAMSELRYEVLVNDGLRRQRDQRLPDGSPIISSPVASTLIYGERDAVLVDPPFTYEQVSRVGDWIEQLRQASDRRLRHPWPRRSLVRHRPAVATVPRRDRLRDRRHDRDDAPARPPSGRAQLWDVDFPGLIPPSPVVYRPIPVRGFELEGHRLLAVEVGHTDTDDTTVLHVPSIGLVVAGDVVYNGVHQYLLESAHGGLEAWLTALDKVAALQPRAVVAGHKNKDLPDDPAIIDQTRKYLLDASGCSPRSPLPRVISTR